MQTNAPPRATVSIQPQNAPASSRRPTPASRGLALAEDLWDLVKPSPKQRPEALNERIRQLIDAPDFAAQLARDKATLALGKGAAAGEARGLCGKLSAWLKTPGQQARLRGAANYGAAIAKVLQERYVSGQLERPRNAADLVEGVTGVLEGIMAGIPKKATVPTQIGDFALATLRFLPVAIPALRDRDGTGASAATAGAGRLAA